MLVDHSQTLVPTWDELKTKYFLWSSDLPADSRLPVIRHASVTPLVDRKDLFVAAYATINSSSGATLTVSARTYRGIAYVANWNPIDGGSAGCAGRPVPT